MPMMLHPVCFRNRTDCEPIQCIDSAPENITEEQLIRCQYKPDSFVCSGCVSSDDRTIKQDLYRLCFKNDVSDEMSDNDYQDLTSIMYVISSAMALDAVRKVKEGVIEVPAEQVKELMEDEK